MHAQLHRGQMLIRHLLSIAILPFTVTVLVPYWIVQRLGVALALGSSPARVALQAAGILVLSLGAAFFVGSVLGFVRHGKGTLAPWDPPRRLVVTGLYRYVRNPMIAGVSLILLAEAMILTSVAHLGWAGLFAGINAIFILSYEEPQLQARFATAYEEYRRNVPRLVPRVRPWTPRDS